MQTGFSVSPSGLRITSPAVYMSSRGNWKLTEEEPKLEKSVSVLFPHGHSLTSCSRMGLFLFHVWVSLFWETVKKTPTQDT